jgi:hypothetical protein
VVGVVEPLVKDPLPPALARAARVKYSIRSLASVIDQVESTSALTNASTTVISKRQAKLQAREAKKDKNKRGAVTTTNSRFWLNSDPSTMGTRTFLLLDVTATGAGVLVPDGTGLATAKSVSLHRGTVRSLCV